MCCLLNFSETDGVSHESASLLLIDATTEPDTDDAMMRLGGPTEGWLFGMDRFGSASDRGEWCIYCEKMNDVAIIALRQRIDVEKYAEHLKQLHAEPIGALLKAGAAAPVPFGQLTAPWRHGLARHYAMDP